MHHRGHGGITEITEEKLSNADFLSALSVFSALFAILFPTGSKSGPS
jgi:hypothetical protein